MTFFFSYHSHHAPRVSVISDKRPMKRNNCDSTVQSVVMGLDDRDLMSNHPVDEGFFIAFIAQVTQPPPFFTARFSGEQHVHRVHHDVHLVTHLSHN